MPRGAAPCRAVFGVVWLLISIVASGTSAGIEIADYEFSGRIGIDGRWYPESALYPGQRSHASGFVLEPEFYIEDVEGRSFTLAPFFRYDAADPRRTHVDLREAYLLLFGGIGDNEWELRLGVDQVFWGVVESQRLVDIINQVDFVEHPDGTAKLGQPMAHATLSGDWGVLELFGLPYHRARTFSGRRGRLRLPLVIDDDNIRYESAAEEWHLDFAARYSNSFGPLDMGLSVFDGTSREPSAQLDFTPAGELNLVQYYTQIRQFGLDAQLILGPWLFKLEAIQRSGALNLRGREEDYMASVIGSEYTLYSVFDSVADLTLFGEWHYDDRDRDAPPSRSPGTFENDLFVAARLAFNDIQSTEMTASFIGDLGRATHSLAVGLDRRLSDRWSLHLEAVVLLGIDREDIHYYARRDSFIELGLSYNF